MPFAELRDRLRAETRERRKTLVLLARRLLPPHQKGRDTFVGKHQGNRTARPLITARAAGLKLRRAKPVAVRLIPKPEQTLKETPRRHLSERTEVVAETAARRALHLNTLRANGFCRARVRRSGKVSG